MSSHACLAYGSVSYQMCSGRAARDLCFNTAGVPEGAAKSCFPLQLIVLLYLHLVCNLCLPFIVRGGKCDTAEEKLI